MGTPKLNQRSTIFSDCETSQVDWPQVAVDAGYKDVRNARAMWSRFAKKLTDTFTVADSVDDKDDDNAGLGPANAPTKGTKKRKATEDPVAGSSSDKGKISLKTRDVNGN